MVEEQRLCSNCGCTLYPEEKGYCDNCLDDLTTDDDVENALMSEWEAQEWERANEIPPYIETVEHSHPIIPPKWR